MIGGDLIRRVAKSGKGSLVMLFSLDKGRDSKEHEEKRKVRKITKAATRADLLNAKRRNEKSSRMCE